MRAIAGHCFVSILVLLSGCGGCGDDTAVEPDAEIVSDPDAALDTTAPTTTADPPGGTYRALPSVTLTADEPATIYWTNDGNEPSTSSTHGDSPLTVSGATIRFFAVDAAGNQESLQRVDYVVDRLGPAALTAFTATPDGDDVDLTWTNPTDAGFADVVVARVTDLSTTLAEDGETYAVSDTLGASTIVYVGNAEAFTDTARGPGHHTYVAWAHYDTGVYAEGRTAATRIATPAQTCQITIDVTGGTATVATQPSSFTLAISNYADVAGAITMDVALTSGLAGITFNPKLVFTGVAGTGGTPTIDNSDGDLDGTDPFLHYGPAGLATGVARTHALALTANAATAITLDCEVVENPGVFYAEWSCPTTDGGGLADLRAMVANGGLPPPNRFGVTPDGREPCTMWHALVLSPDQRYLYAGPRSGKVVSKIDATTFTSVGGLDITVTGTAGSASNLTLDPSGRRLYVGVNDGSHGGRQNTGGDNEGTAVTNLVVEIATADMTEAARVTVGTGDGQHRLSRTAMTADGRRLGLSIGGDVYATTPVSEVHFYDVSTWTELDTDTTTAGIQPFALGNILAANIAFDPSGRYAVLGSAGDQATRTSFGLVDFDDLTLTTLTGPADATAAGRVITASWDVDAFLLWTHNLDRLQRLDPSTGTITPVGAHDDVISARWSRASARVGDDLWVIAYNGATRVDPTTGEELDSFDFEADLHQTSFTR